MPSSEPLRLTASEQELLALVRTKGVSIRQMEPARRGALREFLVMLHFGCGMSLNDIAKLIGNKTSGYTSWLCRELGVKARPFEEARLKGISEKRRKYERRAFDGTDEDRAYLLGLRHGDLSVSRPWNGVVRVSTSTTHPAMAELFHSLFGPYGHVYQYPRYKKDTGTYEWNVQTVLDESFSFILQGFDTAEDWISGSPQRTLAWLSGFLDAEGSILVTHSVRGRIVVFVDYYNENKTILKWIERQAKLRGLGTSLRVNKPIGVGRTGFHLNHNREYFQLSLFSARRIFGYLRGLTLRHPEKLARRALALATEGMSNYDAVEAEVVLLRTQIKADVSSFVKLARDMYLKTHPSARGEEVGSAESYG